MEAFAERARIELASTGEHARGRTVDKKARDLYLLRRQLTEAIDGASASMLAGGR